jgi:hypothetical protein
VKIVMWRSTSETAQESLSACQRCALCWRTVESVQRRVGHLAPVWPPPRQGPSGQQFETCTGCHVERPADVRTPRTCRARATPVSVVGLLDDFTEMISPNGLASAPIRVFPAAYVLWLRALHFCA